MIELGKRQQLMILKTVDFGVYLYDGEDQECTVLLPAKQVPENAEVGDLIDVFIYRDSQDRLIATTRYAALELGGLAVLKVAEVTKIGAFLDWGLEKDLFMPFKSQTRRVKEGDECLVTLYIDKSSRLCATMNVYQALHTDSTFVEGERVTGRIYQSSDNFGMFVAVEDRYSGLIPKRECHSSMKVGDIVNVRITKIHPDGKLDLSVRDKAYLQMETDAERILEVLDEFSGVLPFNDKASPEVIRREFGLSKAAFKRAVGRLLKEGRIEITDSSIRRKNLGGQPADAAD